MNATPNAHEPDGDDAVIRDLVLSADRQEIEPPAIWSMVFATSCTRMLGDRRRLCVRSPPNGRGGYGWRAPARRPSC